MKTMTCRQLGGACEKTFHGNTFEELAAQSRQHGMEMMQANDAAHLQAMKEMREHMTTPEKMKEWMDGKKKLFDSIPHSN